MQGIAVGRGKANSIRPSPGKGGQVTTAKNEKVWLAGTAEYVANSLCPKERWAAINIYLRYIVMLSLAPGRGKHVC